MDIYVLLCTTIILKRKPKALRSILGALFGAIYSCIILVIGINNSVVEILMTYIVANGCMCIIVFGVNIIDKMIVYLLTMLLNTFFISGIIEFIYARGIRLDAGSLLVVGGLCAIIYKLVIKALLRKLKTSNQILSVILFKGANKIEVTALIDTGNSLVEPFTKKPVCVVSKAISERLKDKNIREMIIIPYKSVGENNGILYGFTADYMIIKDGKEIYGDNKITKPILAEYDGAFGRDGEFNMLINPLILIDKGV